MTDQNIPCESDSYPSTETRACQRCNKAKPLSSFVPRRRPGSRSHTCRACYKTDQRRRRGILPKARTPREQRRVTLLRIMYRELRRLLDQKCEGAGIAFRTVVYRTRYQHSPAFRASEVSRRWERKRVERAIPADGTLTPQVVRSLFASATHCPYCTEPMHPRVKTLDHLTPTSRGGVHSIDNVVVCCSSCNSRKSDRTPVEWMGSAWFKANSGRLRHSPQVVVAA